MDLLTGAREHAREAGSAAHVVLQPTTNLNDLLASRLADEPDAVLAEVRSRPGAPWRPVTVREFDAEVVAVAKGLVAYGIRPGDTVAVMCRTRYEWTVLDFAIWAAGAVGVPIHEASSAAHVEWVLVDAGVRLLVVETAADAALAESVRPSAPDLGDVLVVDAGALATLAADGCTVDDTVIARRRAAATMAELATIVFTPGTTGRPKGVELTHGNLATLAANTVLALPEVFEPAGRTLLVQPLAHLLARFAQVAAVTGGMVLGHTPDERTLADDLRTFRPTSLVAVPRVLEEIVAAAQTRAARSGRLRRFRWATSVAVACSRALAAPRGPARTLRLQRRAADRLVLDGLRAALGGQVAYVVSGGGPRDERVGHLYRGLGIEVLEGYGLTESTAPATVNRPGRARLGTVGQALPGCRVRIAEDGEVLLAGPHVFRAYHRDPCATDEAFVGEWLRTGDLGSLDDDGFLTITGRTADLVAAASGDPGGGRS